MIRYYFSFSNSTTHPISRLFKRGFQHVEMVTELDNGQVMHINPRWGAVEYGLTNEIPLHKIIARLKELEHTVVIFRCPAPDPRAMIVRGPIMTCASYLAYTIGLSFPGLTPYHLYKTLIARGGEIV